MRVEYERPSKWKLRWGVFITKLTNIFVNPALVLLGRDVEEFWFDWWTGGREKFWANASAFFKALGKFILAFLRHPLVVATWSIVGGYWFWKFMVGK